MRELTLTVAILAAMTASAKGQSGLGDASQGRELARKVCAECHRVEKGEMGHKLALATAFQKIANNPARTELSLRVFLRSPHINMPNLILTEAETDNLVAYILSLK